MVDGKTFVKKFASKNSLYIYDVNSNEIIRAGNRVYDLIDEIVDRDTNTIFEKYKDRYSVEEIRGTTAEIENARRQHHLFSTHHPVISSGYRSAEDVRKALDHNLSQVLLEVTTRCNLRCKYCEFSRRDGDDDMPVDIAFRAIEYFLEKSKIDKGKIPPAISVYGGEPLLRFDLIKEILAFAKKKGMFDKLHFSLTTNGTLLTDEIIKFFADNNVSILLSLDGPKRITDRFRVFPDGRGVFDSILLNLKKIKRNYPTYFKEKISINAVISPPYPFDQVISFFSSRKVFEPIRDKISVNLVDEHDMNVFKNSDHKERRDKLDVELRKMLKRYKRRLIRGNYSQLTLEKSFFLEDFYTISRRKIVPLKSQYPPMGACLPGQRRLFVSTKGKFYMCEKVGSNYEIGDVERGLDFDKIFGFIKAYDEFFKECGNCWALRLCKKCFNDIRKEDGLDEGRRNAFCEFMLHKIEADLITFCEILEENPDAFSVLEKVVMV